MEPDADEEGEERTENVEGIHVQSQIFIESQFPFKIIIFTTRVSFLLLPPSLRCWAAQRLKSDTAAAREGCGMEGMQRNNNNPHSTSVVP